MFSNIAFALSPINQSLGGCQAYAWPIVGGENNSISFGIKYLSHRDDAANFNTDPAVKGKPSIKGCAEVVDIVWSVNVDGKWSNYYTSRDPGVVYLPQGTTPGTKNIKIKVKTLAKRASSKAYGGWLIDVYANHLCRTPDISGWTYWTQVIQAHSQGTDSFVEPKALYGGISFAQWMMQQMKIGATALGETWYDSPTCWMQWEHASVDRITEATVEVKGESPSIMSSGQAKYQLEPLVVPNVTRLVKISPNNGYVGTTTLNLHIADRIERYEYGLMQVDEIAATVINWNDGGPHNPTYNPVQTFAGSPRIVSHVYGTRYENGTTDPNFDLDIPIDITIITKTNFTIKLRTWYRLWANYRKDQEGLGDERIQVLDSSCGHDPNIKVPINIVDVTGCFDHGTITTKLWYQEGSNWLPNAINQASVSVKQMSMMPVLGSTTGKKLIESFQANLNEASNGMYTQWNYFNINPTPSKDYLDKVTNWKDQFYVTPNSSCNGAFITSTVKPSSANGYQLTLNTEDNGVCHSNEACINTASNHPDIYKWGTSDVNYAGSRPIKVGQFGHGRYVLTGEIPVSALMYPGVGACAGKDLANISDAQASLANYKRPIVIANPQPTGDHGW